MEIAVVEELVAGTDLAFDGLDAAGLAGVAQELVAGRRWFDRQLMLVAAQRDGRDVLAGTREFSARQTRAFERRSAVVARFPDVAGLSGGHLDAIANAVEALGEHAGKLEGSLEELLERAATTGPDSFARAVRARVAELSDDGGVACLEQQKTQIELSRSTNRQTGMRDYYLSLDPENADRVDTQLDAEIKRLWAAKQRDRLAPDTRSAEYAGLAAQAIINLCTRTGGAKIGVPEIILIVDHETLASDTVRPGGEARTGKGTLLPPETLRRHACDARIIPVSFGVDGQQLNAGRAMRHPTGVQRTVLRALYLTCGVDGCTVGFDWCHIHHVKHWSRGGPTDIANLVPLCSRHHHKVHEGRWTVHLAPDRTLTVRYPDGTLQSVSQPAGQTAATERATRRARAPTTQTTAAA